MAELAALTMRPLRRGGRTKRPDDVFGPSGRVTAQKKKPVASVSLEELYRKGPTSVARLWARVKALGLTNTKADVTEFVREQKEASRFRRPDKPQPRGTAGFIAANRPWGQVAADIMFEKKRGRLWLIVVDIYSGYLQAVRLKDRKQPAVKAAFKKAFAGIETSGMQLFTDREPAWTTKTKADRETTAPWLTELGIAQVFVEHSSQAERAIRSIRESIRDRDVEINFARVAETVDTINETPNAVTRVKPEVAVEHEETKDLAEVQYRRRRAVAKRQVEAPDVLRPGAFVRVTAPVAPFRKKSRGDDVPNKLYVLEKIARNYAYVKEHNGTVVYKVKKERLKAA